MQNFQEVIHYFEVGEAFTVVLRHALEKVTRSNGTNENYRNMPFFKNYIRRGLSEFLLSDYRLHFCLARKSL